MTLEEAITILKIAKTEVEWNYPLDYAIAIDTAIEALEKQIPMSLVDKDEKEVCPKCEMDFLHGPINFCHTCGQAIDWSEEE